MRPNRHTTDKLKRVALALALGIGLGAGSASAQTIIEVGGDGVIGDETLTSNALATTGANWTAGGGGGVVYSNLTTQTLTVPSDGVVTLKFNHRYFLEDDWDGGAVFMSVDGGEFTHVPASAFSANGYVKVLSSSSTLSGGIYGPFHTEDPDPAIDVFTGASTDWATPAYIESVASLGTFTTGQTIAVEFRGGWDWGYVEAAPNWEITSVQVTDAASADMLNVNFVADGRSGFTVNNIGGVSDPWSYIPLRTFELDAVAKTADRYAPVSPGDAIDLNGADLVVEVLTGELALGDTFELFDLSGGTTLTGSYNSITLPPGTGWDLSGLEPGGNGQITFTRLVGFKLLMRDVTNAQVDNTTKAETIIALEAPDATYTFTDTEVIRSVIDVAGGGGNFGVNDPLPDGTTDAAKEDYILRATTNVVIPAGDWSIGFASDDGGTLKIPGITFLSKTNATGADDEVRFEGTRGHAWTWGTFTLTEPLTTTIDALMFERGGGDSFELAFVAGHATEAPAGWQLLADGIEGWTIEWADTTAPSIVDLNPADDFMGSFVSGNLVATFDEDIALSGTGTVTIDNLDGGTDIVISLPDTRVSVNGPVLSIDPGSNLAFDTNYAVQISPDAVVDIPDPVSNPFVGITDTTTWNFKTLVEDTTPPAIASVDPDGTAISPNASLVLTFDENILLANATATVLLGESFDSDDGGFTLKVAEAAGSPWAHGTPESTGAGGTIDTDNSGTGQCWGTNIGNPGYYADPTNTCLRSPVIDLTTVSAATLTFAEALDVEIADTAELRIIEAATDTVIATVYTVDDSGDIDNAPWEAANGGAPIDLSAGLGQEVRLEWCLAGVGGTTDDYMGWYIDDVQVTAIDPATAITLKNLDTGTITLIPVSDSSQVSVSGAVLTITPAGLNPGANYAVQIGANAIRNYSDVNFAGISDDATWTFATLDQATFVTAANLGTNSDTWTAGDNWDTGSPPTGTQGAIIQAGLTALANSVDVVTYSGGLNIEAGSTLQVGSGGNTENRTQSALALGTGPITMEEGSKIQWQMKVGPTPPALVLNGDASIVLASNESHARQFNFANGISGPGKLTFLGVNNGNHTFTAANPDWSGGFEGGISSNTRTTYNANAAGCFGSGDVTIRDNGCDLKINTSDVMDSTATLTLSGLGRDNNVVKLTMGGSQTVDKLWVDSIQYPAGTYSGSGPADFVGLDWISGSGVLTVTNGPNDGIAPTVLSITDNKPGGQMFDNGSATFTVTFSDPMIASTIEVGDFENIGTATTTVDSVTPVALDVFEVLVSASSTGTVQLQIKAGANMLDFGLDALDTSSGIPDDAVINVIPFVANAASLVADFQATIASEQHPTYAGEARYFHVSVNPANPGTGSYAATIVGTNNPAPVFVRNYDGPVLSYKFLGGTNNSISGVAASGGDDTLITYATEDAVFDGYGQGQAKIWDATDPGADLATGGADPYNVSTNDKNGGGYRSFGGAVCTVDISGMSAGSLHIYYGSFSARPSVSVSLVDSTGLNPDVTLPNVHLNNDNADRTEYYLAEVDFVTDGIYDIIEYTWLANGSNYDGNGRGLGTVLTGPAVGGNAYDDWATDTGGDFLGTLTDTDSALDFDAGGLPTGIEWVVGGDPTNGSDDAGLAPSIDTTTSPGNALFVFRRTDEAAADAKTAIIVEYGSDLQGWIPAENGVGSVSIVVDDDGFEAGVDKVTVTLPTSLAVDGELYARLNVVISP